MALVPDERDHFTAKITCRYFLGKLHVIKDNLRGANTQLFKESCFGQFLDMKPMQFQGQVVLHLLFSQDCSNPSDNFIFHFNQKQSEFGPPNEFSLIIGLCFGPTTLPLPKKSEFHKLIFGAKPKWTFKDVAEAFNQFSVAENGKGETALKLALLYVLYGVLLVRPATKKVDMQYFHLVNNLEEFNAYPWGRVAFTFLVNEICSCMRGRVATYRKRLKTDKKPKALLFDLHGFTHALQIWAYEVMPSVASLCAERVSKDMIPRVLRWEADAVVRSSTLIKEEFFSLEVGDRAVDKR